MQVLLCYRLVLLHLFDLFYYPARSFFGGESPPERNCLPYSVDQNYPLDFTLLERAFLSLNYQPANVPG